MSSRLNSGKIADQMLAALALDVRGIHTSAMGFNLDRRGSQVRRSFFFWHSRSPRESPIGALAWGEAVAPRRDSKHVSEIRWHASVLPSHAEAWENKRPRL